MESPSVRLAVGISEALVKLAVCRLMQPVMQTPKLRLICQEDEFEDLLAEFALHRLDLVLADRPAPSNRHLKVYSHSLGSPDLSWYAPAPLLAAARRGFPQSLATVPVLLPTSHAAVRSRINHWFERLGVKPKIVGKFEVSALLMPFSAGGGIGVFPAADQIHSELAERHHVKRIVACYGVAEHFYAIGAHKKVLHPLVQKLLPG